jgi:hypothetical protein
MTTTGVYRKYAVESMESAQRAKSDEECAQFLDLAEAWLRAATVAKSKKLREKTAETIKSKHAARLP